MFPRYLLSSLCLACASSACGAAPAPADDPAPPADEASAAGGGEVAAVLTFGDVAFFADGEPGPVLFSDGHVEMQGETIATFHADGRLVSSEGELLATLHPDGTLQADALGGRGGTIEEDGTLRHGELVLRMDDAGLVTGGPEEMPTLRAEGVDARSQRAAMFIIALFVLSAGG